MTDETLPERTDTRMLMNIIERASQSPELDLERLEKWLDLKDRWDRAEAQRAFAAAKVEFKRHAPLLLKNKAVAFGNTAYMHATHHEVTSKISEALAQHGFSHSWSMTQDAARITVKCTLSHVAGHSEYVELSSAPDQSGGKNSIQAIASATNYLQRYTLLAVTGLSTADAPDDDGKAAEGVAVPLLQEVWTSLDAAAKDGTQALVSQWRAINEADRAIIVLHYANRWADLKAYAGSVPKFTEKAEQ